MKRTVFLFILFSYCSLFAQEVQVVLPKSKVTAGTAFQLQFVVTGASAVSVDPSIAFPNFQLVSGPNIYKGNTIINGEQKGVNNIVYTLVPLSTGNFSVKGITVAADNKVIEAKEVSIAVAAPPKLSFNVSSSYTDVSLYAPSSRVDIDKVIKENLFVKAEVNKTTCYQGEAIVATFKLYSRLQSVSEVVKMPAFYGFTAVDMQDITKPAQSVETVDVKVFNTSILRKVQLYPTRSGKQMIDPIRINSLIEFGDDLNDARKIEVQKEVSTPSIQINVKSLPEKQPENFEGAVGNFQIKAFLESAKISSKQQGRLTVILAGKGNFFQITAPQVTWSKGVDVYQLPAKEKLDKTNAPIEGEKTFVFGFSSSQIGRGKIPPIQFTFFNPRTKQFEMIASDSINYEMVDTIVAMPGRPGIKVPASSGIWIWIGISGLLLISIVIVLFQKKKKAILIQPASNTRDYVREIEMISSQNLTDKELAYKVQQIIHDLLLEKYGTSRLDIVKGKLAEQQFEQLKAVLSTCQEIAYTNVFFEGRKETLLKEVHQLVKQL